VTEALAQTNCFKKVTQLLAQEKSKIETDEQLNMVLNVIDQADHLEELSLRYKQFDSETTVRLLQLITKPKHLETLKKVVLRNSANFESQESC